VPVGKKCILMIKTMNNIWKIWCKALGEKSGNTDRQSDGIAFIRTMLVIQAIITNLFIVANIVRNWY
jgi:hypothetical protein